MSLLCGEEREVLEIFEAILHELEDDEEEDDASSQAGWKMTWRYSEMKADDLQNMEVEGVGVLSNRLPIGVETQSSSHLRKMCS
jgi:hypothetical protein